MKKSLLIILAFFLFSFKTSAPATWTFDGNHSNLVFSITHLMISEIRGSFKIREASLQSARDDFDGATVFMRADVASVDTDNEERDAHLARADLLDAEKYPSIIFKSSSFKKTGEGRYAVTGNLEMHGQTKPVTLEVRSKTIINPLDKKTVAGFKVTGVIKRSDYGIATTTPVNLLSDEVFIEANVEFVKN